METYIKRVLDLNRTMMPPYYLLTEKEEVVKEKGPPAVISSEMPKFDITYFDLVAVNILLANHSGVVYEPPPEIVELTCNMFYIANMRCGIYTPVQAETVYESLAFGRIPPNMLVYQFLNKVVQDKSRLADVWLQYMLLLWGLNETYTSNTRPYRSRALVGYINRCMLTSNRNEHKHDLQCDNLGILEFLRGYILLCTRDKLYQGDGYIRYMVDSIRMLVVVYLAAMIRRSCTWPELCRLGDMVLNQKCAFHETIVRMHHEIHKQTGAVNQ